MVYGCQFSYNYGLVAAWAPESVQKMGDVITKILNGMRRSAYMNRLTVLNDENIIKCREAHFSSIKKLFDGMDAEFVFAVSGITGKSSVNPWAI